ncbi:MAG: DUF2442 domain-containing protein [Acetobacteraceae bacterium]|nr:DUF2442 domain-containing protein [Acetobacteraceae bacterium]
MTDDILHHIDHVDPLPGYRLRVWWRAGGQSLVDFSDDVADGPVWAPLRDERLFAKVQVIDNGRVIEWPEPRRANGWPVVDIDADGLWYTALQQSGAVAAE